MNRRLYALHRWISLLAAWQLLAWSVSGLFFAVVPETRVKGSPTARGHVAPVGAPLATLGAITDAATVALGSAPERLEIVGTPAGPFVVARSGKGAVRLDARTAAPAPVDKDDAASIAQRDQPGSPAVRAVTRIEADAGEFRGRPVPAWRVDLSDAAETHVYVDARTGEVSARRNSTWRIYDFLWGLHIMDYREHDDFRHPLLVVAAGLAVVTALSGLLLWAIRLVRSWRRRGVSSLARA